jgi:hypothetical protein
MWKKGGGGSGSGEGKKRKISLPWFRQSSLVGGGPFTRQHTLDSTSSLHKHTNNLCQVLRLGPKVRAGGSMRPKRGFAGKENGLLKGFLRPLVDFNLSPPLLKGFHLQIA